MKDKINRLEIIKSIIGSNRIGGQEELLTHLRRQGFDLTQATLSRDLKQLQVVKVAHQGGGYQYVLPEMIGLARTQPPRVEYPSAVANGFLSIAFSGNLTVIKTRPGYAGSIASDIDVHAMSEFLGSVAGDDTVLLVMREGVSREEVIAALRIIIPNISL
ncbi:MAG: ArgR family transcriptional regulator [Coprobacter sp.]|nr:ArgR family transcriptional regulator [Coprobacter sp.]